MKIQVLKRDVWMWGVHTVGYEFGKVHNDYFVHYFYPARNEIKIYRTEKGALRQLDKRMKFYGYKK